MYMYTRARVCDLFLFIAAPRFHPGANEVGPKIGINKRGLRGRARARARAGEKKSGEMTNNNNEAAGKYQLLSVSSAAVERSGERDGREMAGRRERAEGGKGRPLLVINEMH